MDDATMEKVFGVLNTSMPNITMPTRDEDCSAAPVCEAVGNLRNGCMHEEM